MRGNPDCLQGFRSSPGSIPAHAGEPLPARHADGRLFFVDPRGLRETIAVTAGAFGWSLAELKRLPLGELLEYSRLAARLPVGCGLQ